MTTDHKAALPDRSHPAHLPVMEMGNRSNIIFVTVCTEMRKEILARQECVEAIKIAWAEASTWRIGRYVIMPNHIHMFCSPGLREFPVLKKWVTYWKSLSAGKWPYPEDGKVWQRDCWDRQLRSGESYAEKWEYVRRNPVRAGLVGEPEGWPWQGELNVLEWHDA
jgi:REP element-mobilizing transposase RayT